MLRYGLEALQSGRIIMGELVIVGGVDEGTHQMD